ncbi:hypothetical protein JCM1393_27580 [Clostridium carnis]
MERIISDRFVLESQDSAQLHIAILQVLLKILLKDGNLLLKVFDKIDYFLSEQNHYNLGYILIQDSSNELILFIDKVNKSIYFEDIKVFLEGDCEYFISKLMNNIDWSIK